MPRFLLEAVKRCSRSPFFAACGEEATVYGSDRSRRGREMRTTQRRTWGGRAGRRARTDSAVAVLALCGPQQEARLVLDVQHLILAPHGHHRLSPLVGVQVLRRELRSAREVEGAVGGELAAPERHHLEAVQRADLKVLPRELHVGRHGQRAIWVGAGAAAQLAARAVRSGVRDAARDGAGLQLAGVAGGAGGRPARAPFAAAPSRPH